MYGHSTGGLMGLLILIVLIIVVYRLFKGEPDTNKEKSARDILDERYAKGEIDADQYKEQKQNLES